MGLQDPADQPLFGFLDGHEVRVIEADTALFIEVLDGLKKPSLGVLQTTRHDKAQRSGQNATVVWCGLPDFDSGSIFAALLDAERGGAFCIDVHASRPDSATVKVGSISPQARYTRDSQGEILPFLRTLADYLQSV